MSLLQLYQNYLNQALPDISGIFRSAPAQAMEETTEETIAQPVGLTPQQLALLYPQDRGGGEDPVNTGFGLFNNLDKTDIRYEVVDGELVPTYRNVTSGLYQTEQGKNVSNLGLNLPFANLLGGIFGVDKTPQYPGYFQQDPATRGGIIDFLSGKTRRDKLEQFRVDQIEKASNISGAEDPSDYLARKRTEEADAARARALRAMRDEGPDRGVGPGNSGSRRGASDISDRDRGGYATDDTASFF